jgi:DNA repair protein SbcC/Rad50
MPAKWHSARAVGAFDDPPSDGPLDPERKRMFMAMKREVLRLGGYEQELFVSQTPELWDLADCVIDVGRLAAGQELTTR